MPEHCCSHRPAFSGCVELCNSLSLSLSLLQRRLQSVLLRRHHEKLTTTGTLPTLLAVRVANRQGGKTTSGQLPCSVERLLRLNNYGREPLLQNYNAYKRADPSGLETDRQALANRNHQVNMKMRQSEQNPRPCNKRIHRAQAASKRPTTHPRSATVS